MTYQYAPADFEKLGQQMLAMSKRADGFTKGEQVLSRAVEAFGQQLDQALAERDRARAIAVALEQEIAALTGEHP